MHRILNDPTQVVCPNFEGPEWAFLRQCIIDSHPGEIPLTAEEVARQMREAWTQDNDARVAAWNAQLEKDRAEQDQQDRQVREVKVVRRAQLEEEAEEQRRVAEKNKPRLNPFDPTRRVSEWIPPRPASYALEKLNDFEYVELDYFTALRPSKNIRKDEDLTWEEMLEAKNTMLHFMAQSGLWPTAHAESLAAFFVALERHPRRLMAHGKTTLLLYQGRVRREWFHAFERNEGFNIGLISDGLLRNIADEVRDKIWKREIDQVRTHRTLDRNFTLTLASLYHPHTLHRRATQLLLFPIHSRASIRQIRRVAEAAFEIPSARATSKRHREWDNEARNHTHSPSPPRALPARKRLRSRSPRPSSSALPSRSS
jgi:hypothetical protein